MFSTFVRFVVPVIALVATACAAHAQTKPSGRPPASRPARAASRPDLDAFGARLEAAIKDCNALAIAGLLDRDALLDAITEGTRVPEPDRTKFFASSAPGLGLGNVICKKMEANGNCRYLGIRQINGRPRALFRIVTTASAFDYYEFVLEGKGDDVRFTDVFLLSSGELFSTHVRASIASDSSMVIYRYVRDHVDLPVNEVLAGMYRLNQTGDAAAILRVYDTLRPALRRVKPVLMYAINAAVSLNGTRLPEFLDSLRVNYPDDPSLDLYLIPLFEGKGDYGSMLAAVDQIDRRVRDPWLNILRSKACMMASRYDLAKRFADSAIAYDSMLIVPRWVLVVVALKDRDFHEAVRLIDFIAAYDNVDAYIAELSKSKVGKEFVASREYAEWKEGRKVQN
jgi:hypothetical protein